MAKLIENVRPDAIDFRTVLNRLKQHFGNAKAYNKTLYWQLMTYHNVNAEDFAQVVSFYNDVTNYVDNHEREGRSSELAYENHEIYQRLVIS